MLAIDECQDWCERNTLVGKAFDLIAGKARKYLISCGVSGVTQGNIVSKLKNQLKIFFIHKPTFEWKIFASKYGLQLDEDDIEEIPYSERAEDKGWCRYYSRLTQNLRGNLLRPDFFYKKLRKKKIDDSHIIKEEDFSRILH